MSGGTWLISGGTGAFGQAFTRYLLDHEDPASVRILSRGEFKQAEMEAAFNDPRLRFLLGDVQNAERVAQACQGVDVVVHAAAMKRIEKCEQDPGEAVGINIVGSGNVALAAIGAGVRRAMMLSTDKACAPDTLYGGTKMVAERAWLRSNVYAAGRTSLSACRYGNITLSTGSVVPIWRKQVLAGKPMTVTDTKMTRFFMGLPDAVQLVLTALANMEGGEVFVPVIGAAPLTTLAAAVASGHPTVTVGMRGGEKIHETLISPDEVRRTYDCGNYYVIVPDYVTWRPHPITPKGSPVPSSFTYSSNTARQLSVDDLKMMI